MPKNMNNKPNTFPFLTYQMINNCDSNAAYRKVASWSNDGSYFIVKDRAALEQDFLSKYYTTSEWSSFQKQLNNYGFRNITKEIYSSGNGEGKKCFCHDYFRKGQQDLLVHIRSQAGNGQKRKSSDKEKDVIIKDLQQENRCLKEEAHGASRIILQLQKENEEKDREIDKLREEFFTKRQKGETVGRSLQNFKLFPWCGCPPAPILAENTSKGTVVPNNVPDVCYGCDMSERLEEEFRFGLMDRYAKDIERAWFTAPL